MLCSSKRFRGAKIRFFFSTYKLGGKKLQQFEDEKVKKVILVNGNFRHFHPFSPLFPLLTATFLHFL